MHSVLRDIIRALPFFTVHASWSGYGILAFELDSRQKGLDEAENDEDYVKHYRPAYLLLSNFTTQHHCMRLFLSQFYGGRGLCQDGEVIVAEFSPEHVSIV